MPRKTTTGTTARKSTAKTAVKTEVRNTAIPKVATAKPVMVITHDAIARRAFEIFASGNGGSEIDNWLRAERELRVAA